MSNQEEQVIPAEQIEFEKYYKIGSISEKATGAYRNIYVNGITSHIPEISFPPMLVVNNAGTSRIDPVYARTEQERISKGFTVNVGNETGNVNVFNTFDKNVRSYLKTNTENILNVVNKSFGTKCTKLMFNGPKVETKASKKTNKNYGPVIRFKFTVDYSKIEDNSEKKSERKSEKKSKKKSKKKNKDDEKEKSFKKITTAFFIVDDLDKFLKESKAGNDVSEMYSVLNAETVSDLDGILSFASSSKYLMTATFDGLVAKTTKGPDSEYSDIYTKFSITSMIIQKGNSRHRRKKPIAPFMVSNVFKKKKPIKKETIKEVVKEVVKEVIQPELKKEEPKKEEPKKEESKKEESSSDEGESTSDEESGEESEEESE